MSLSSILFFAATELVLCLVPGPAVLLVISQAMKRGFRTSTRGAFGILAGNAIYFALSAAGLGALLMTSRVVFEVIRYAGAGYLMLVGFRMIFFASSVTAAPEAESRSFVQGLITQLANPKAIVFFTALLPQFVNPHGPLALQFLILGIVSIAIEFPVLAMYGFAADRGRALYGRHARVLERAAGGCLVIAGAKLAAQ